MPKRVSPIETIRAEIDEAFATGPPIDECLEGLVRHSLRLVLPQVPGVEGAAWRGRGVAAGVVATSVRQPLAQVALPQDLPTAAVQGQGHELAPARHRHIVVSSGGGLRLRLEDVTDRDCSCEKDARTPDDRRRVSQPGDRRLPAHVAGLAPLQGWIRVRRDAGTQGTAPLGPEAIGVGAAAIGPVRSVDTPCLLRRRSGQPVRAARADSAGGSQCGIHRGS